MRVLAGDVGGTHARLAVVDVDRDHIRIERNESYPSRRYPGLGPIVRAFLAGGAADAVGFERATFGIAGPVVNGECVTPNLPWTVNARALGAELGIPRTRLINDLDAIAYGLPRMTPADLVPLQDGTAVAGGVIALIGAGTGLGQSFVVHQAGRYRPHASEGGHASFAARTELEAELLLALTAEFGRVSWERLLSGPGLVNIYRFLAARDGAREVSAVRDEVARDGAAAISRHALRRSDAVCVEALDLFAAAYGAQAGNLALTVLATGGVYVVGGIAPAIIDKLTDGAFMQAFRDKGRLGTLLAGIPVHVVMNPNIGLLGAAVAATEDLELPAAPSAGAPGPATTAVLGAR